MDSSTATQVAEIGTDTTTLVEAFHHTAAEHADRVAIRTKGDGFTITWSELKDRADALAGGLAKLGLKRGDTIALMFNNRPEFHLADLAAMTIGATPFSIYQTYAPEQIQYVVSDAGARIAIVEQAFHETFMKAKEGLPDLEHVIVVDPPSGGQAASGSEGTLRLEDVEGSNPDFDAEAAAAEVTPDDILTLIYTSGTTGPPKGVELAHKNLMAAVRAARDIIEFPVGSRVISWLPSAHIAERAAHHYIPMAFGFTITTCDDPRQIVSFLPEVRPNWFFAVPRIWEKMKAGLETMLSQAPDEEREKAEQAIQAGIKKVQLEQAGEEVPEDLAAAVEKADAEMFSALRKQLGLDEVTP